MMNPPISRLVVLGASNLSLGMASVLAAARGAWGRDLEVLAAPGYGRSYGAPSSIPFRTLPGILGCGLWDALGRLPAAPTRALVTDVGDDIPYGVAPSQILGWVEAAINRLSAHTADIVLTNLPIEGIRRLTRARFLFFRSLFFPSCRLSRDESLARAEEVNGGLIRLAADRQVRLARLKPHWYGFDPIHIHPRCWRAAWPDILLGDSAEEGRGGFSLSEWARAHTLPPERRRLFGVEREVAQVGRPLRRGGRLWLY